MLYIVADGLLLVMCYDNKMVKLPKGFLLLESLHATNPKKQKKNIYFAKSRRYLDILKKTPKVGACVGVC